MSPLRDRNPAVTAAPDPPVGAPSILRNITWLTAGNVLAKPLWFLFITAFCMRILGASGYGVVTAALSLMSIAAVFSDLGTTEYSIREVARSRQAASVYFSNLLASRSALVLGTWAAALALGWALGYRGGAMAALVFAGVYAMALRMTDFCRGFYRAFEVLRLEAISLIVEKVLVIGLGLAMLQFSPTPAGVLAGMGAGMSITLLLNVAWIHRRLTPFRLPTLDVAFVRRTFHLALPLGMYGLFTFVYMGTGPVLLKTLAGETEAGQYGAAYRILEALQFFPMVVGAAAFPRLASLFHERQMAAYALLVRRSLLSLGVLSAGVALFLSVLGPTVMHLLDPDPEFEAAGHLLRILIWAFPLWAMNYVFTMALITADQQRFLSVICSASAAVTILLNLLLIPLYSYYGTVAALFVGAVINIVCCGWRYHYITRQQRVVSAE